MSVSRRQRKLSLGFYMDHQQFTVAKCSACGTSPVNHYVLLLNDYFNLYIIDPLRKVGSTVSRWRIFRWLEARLIALFLFILSTLRIIRFSKDQSKAVSGRSELIWKEAARRGIEMEQVLFLWRPLEYYRAKIGGRWEYFQSIPIPRRLIKGEYEVRLDDKFLLARDLRSAGIPVPISHTVSSLAHAHRAFDALTKPVIMKPRNGSRGRHTTTNIHTREQLESAYRLCRAIAKSIVVQEHLFGSVYRGTVVGGKLVGFFKANPPQITGDGKHTIHELVRQMNQARPEKLGEIRINDDAIAFLARLNLSPHAIPEKGRIVDLSAKTGRFYGGHTKEMFEEVHPEFVRYFEQAAEVMNAPVVGFDAIMEDPTKSPDNQRWGIIEGNSLPFIDLHYFAFEGKTRDIAPFVWDLWA